MLSSAICRVRGPLSLRSPGKTLVLLFIIFSSLGTHKNLFPLFSPEWFTDSLPERLPHPSSPPFALTLKRGWPSGVLELEGVMQGISGSRDDSCLGFGFLKSHPASVLGRSSKWQRGGGDSWLSPRHFSITKSYSEKGTARQQGCGAQRSWMATCPAPQLMPVARIAERAGSLSTAPRLDLSL